MSRPAFALILCALLLAWPAAGQTFIRSLPTSTNLTSATKIPVDDATYGTRAITFNNLMAAAATNAAVLAAIADLLDLKVDAAAGTLTGGTLATSATFSYATANTVPYFNGSKSLVSSAVTPTELGYLSGVTSALQTQLAAKAPLASPAFTGTPTAPTPSTSDSSTKVATTAFTKNAVAFAFDQIVVDNYQALVTGDPTIAPLVYVTAEAVGFWVWVPGSTLTADDGDVAEVQGFENDGRYLRISQ